MINNSAIENLGSLSTNLQVYWFLCFAPEGAGFKVPLMTMSTSLIWPVPEDVHIILKILGSYNLLTKLSFVSRGNVFMALKHSCAEVRG